MACSARSLRRRSAGGARIENAGDMAAAQVRHGSFRGPPGNTAITYAPASAFTCSIEIRAAASMSPFITFW